MSLLLTGAGPTPSAWSPARLTGLVVTVLPALSRNRGLLWQDEDQTVPAVANGDPVWASVCPFTGVGLTADNDNRPLLYNEGGGKWSLAFDGVDDWLRRVPGVLANGQDQYWYAAAWLKTGTDNAVVVEHNVQYGQPLANSRRGCLITLGSSVGFNGQSNDANFMATYAGSGAYQTTVCRVRNSASPMVRLRQAGTDYTADATGGVGSLNLSNGECRIGSKIDNSEYLNGRIAGLLIGTGALSDDDVLLVEAYLSALYP